MTISVAIIVDDLVIATSADPGAVRVASAMIASAPIADTEPAVLVPIEAGRKQSCQMIASGDA
jgi:hypothetical protein